MESLNANQPFGYAPHLMYENGFRHVPVVENGRPLGMVFARDALELEAEEFGELAPTQVLAGSHGLTA